MGERCIVCVDDEAIIAESLRRELKADFPGAVVVAAYSGPEALSLMAEHAEAGRVPAVLVTDERMPQMPGHLLLREARLRYPDLYGILITGYLDFNSIAEAVNEAGLFRYVHKPWERRDLAMAVGRALDLYDRDRELVQLRAEIQRLNTALIAALEHAGSEEPRETDFRHVQRVGCFSALLAKKLGLDAHFIRKLYLYAPLHDIGKSGIPHDILNKPGRLSEEEFDIIKTHVAIGTRILKSIEVDPIARDLILYHHERWDGKGYLAELSGERIPISARIVALADTLDAMMSRRSYKDERTFNDAADEILQLSGTRFDPAVVDAFARDREEFRKIAEYRSSLSCVDVYLPK